MKYITIDKLEEIVLEYVPNTKVLKLNFISHGFFDKRVELYISGVTKKFEIRFKLNKCTGFLEYRELHSLQLNWCKIDDAVKFAKMWRYYSQITASSPEPRPSLTTYRPLLLDTIKKIICDAEYEGLVSIIKNDGNRIVYRFYDTIFEFNRYSERLSPIYYTYKVEGFTIYNNLNICDDAQIAESLFPTDLVRKIKLNQFIN